MMKIININLPEGMNKPSVATSTALLVATLPRSVSLAFRSVRIRYNACPSFDSADVEVRRLRDLDEKIDWKRISVKDLAKCYCSPTFFDPQGFVFHLPAFLIAELNDKHPYGFIDRLYATDEHPQGWRPLLTGMQRDAIVATLELIREHPNYKHEMDAIDASINRYRSAQKMG